MTQVVSEIEGVTDRTLPSPSATWMPPVPKLCAPPPLAVGSQLLAPAAVEVGPSAAKIVLLALAFLPAYLIGLAGVLKR